MASPLGQSARAGLMPHWWPSLRCAQGPSSPPPWRSGGPVGPSRVRARGPSSPLLARAGGPVWPGQAPTSSPPPAAGPSLLPKGQAGGPRPRSALCPPRPPAVPPPVIHRGGQRTPPGASTGPAAPILVGATPGSASAGLLPSFPLAPAVPLLLFPSVLRLLPGLLFPALPLLPFPPFLLPSGEGRETRPWEPRAFP